MTEEPNEFLETALRYAARGFAVLPLHSMRDSTCTCGNAQCSSPAKHPRTEHGLRDATKDPEAIRRWWERWPDANIGIATGESSGVVVLDVDPGHGGKESLDTLQDAIGPLPATLTAWTGGGGCHYFFRYPGIELRNSAGKLGPGLDTRGDGGYVVAAPSGHASGGVYSWASEEEPAALPRALLDLLVAPPPRGGATIPAAMGSRVDASPYGLAALLRECEEVAASPEGTRNDRLNRAAFRIGQLIAGGEVERHAAEEHLLFAAQRSGLPLREAVRTVKSGIEAGSTEPRSAPRSGGAGGGGESASEGGEEGPGERPKTLFCTDLGNARRLVRSHANDIRHCGTLGWYAWDGRRWKRDETGMAMRIAKSVADHLWDEVRQATTPDEAKRRTAWAMKSQGAARLAAMLLLASTEIPIAVTSEEFDRDPWLLNVRNGTLDLRSGTLRPHRREDLLTKLAPVEFDPHAACPVFERFLDQVFEGKKELIVFMQKACGYALCADVSEQVLFFLHGEGANGKSTLIEVLLHILGEYGAPAAPDLLLTRRGERHPTELADLFGRRFVSCVEVGQGRGINEALVKWLTGGDRLKGRYMRMDFFEFIPTHKVFLSANHKPRVKETNHAFWRRIRLVPFNVIFRPRPAGATGEPGPREQDPDLPRKLKAEAAGILRWAVEGFLRMQAEGLAPPKEVVDATNEYRQGEDVLGQFFSEVCVLVPGARAGKTELYDAYTAWAKQSGEDALPNREFRKALLERHFVEDRGTGGKRIWVGIGLAHDGASHPASDAVTRADQNTGMVVSNPIHDPPNPKSASPRVTASPDGANLFPTTPSDDDDGEAF